MRNNIPSINKNKGLYSQLIGREETELIRDTVNDGPNETILHKPKIETHRVRSTLNDFSTMLTPLTTRGLKSSLPEGAYSRRRTDIANVEPKVFEPFKNHIGKAPRKVIIDRKIKEFNSMDIHSELRRYGVDFSIKSTTSEAFLKLEWFDDSSQEVRPPHSMIKLANTVQEVVFLPEYFYQVKEFDDRLRPESKQRRHSQPSIGAIGSVINRDWIDDPENAEAVKESQNRMRSSKEFSQSKGLDALALKLDQNGLGEQQPCLVQKYDEKTEMQMIRFEVFSGNMSKNNDWEFQLLAEQWIHKIQVVFKVEDTRVYAKRVSNAFEQRRKAYKEIEFNYQIDNMPLKGGQFMLPEIEAMISQNLGMFRSKVKQIGNNCKKWIDQPELVEMIFGYTKQDFARTMNKLVFTHYMNSQNSSLIYKKIKIPIKESHKETPKAGKKDSLLSKTAFAERFNQFKLMTLQVKEEVCQTMIEIKQVCDYISQSPKVNIYLCNFEKIQKLDEFRQSQNTNINGNKTFVMEQMEDRVKFIIERNLENVGKGWFNLNESSKESYEFSKLKKFLNIVKFMTQEALYNLTYNSVQRLINSFNERVPKDILIKSSTEVHNTYFGFESGDQDEDELPSPILTIELQGSEQGKFVYNSNLEEFAKSVCESFKEGIKSMNQVDLIERKLLEDFQKSEPVHKVKCPVLSEDEPTFPSEDERRKGAIPDENIWVQEGFKQTQNMIYKSIEAPSHYLSLFSKFSNEIMLDPEEYFDIQQGRIKETVDLFLQQSELGIANDDEEQAELTQELTALISEINNQVEREKEIDAQFPDEIIIGIQLVSCKEIKSTMIDKHKTINKKLIELIYTLIKYQQIEVRRLKESMLGQLKVTPPDIKNLAEIKKQMGELPIIIGQMNSKIEHMYEMQEFLDSHMYDFPKEDLFDKWVLKRFTRDIYEVCEKKNIDLEGKSKGFQDTLKEEQVIFESTIKDLIESVDNLISLQDPDEYKTQAEKIMNLDKDIKNSSDRANKINEDEQLFGSASTNQNIKQIQKNFDFYKGLWMTQKNWKINHIKWLSCGWDYLDGAEVEEEVINYKTTLAKSRKQFKLNPAAENLVVIIENLLKEINEFERFVPLAVHLRCKGMWGRHWSQLSKEIGFKVSPTIDKFCLQTLIDMNLTKHLEIIEEVSIRAQKEYGIQMELSKIDNAWANCDFIFMNFKNSDILLIKNFEECIALNDEHLGTITNLFQSPQKAVFDEEIHNRKVGLEMVSEVLELWMKLQVSYMQLQPIFTSDDIQKSLPQYFKMFKQSDTRWKQTTATADKQKRVFDICNNEALRNTLNEDLMILDKVQKNLENYLNLKKSNFSRLFFLSDDELLKILSNTKEPRNINDYLKKIFESMEHIIFTDFGAITDMCSKEGEQVALFKEITTKNKSVEIWCKELEMMMVETVRDFMVKGIDKQSQMDRVEWVKSSFGQCVLNGSQVWWTKETEEAINKHQLDKQYKKTQQQILDLVDVIRTKLTKLEKKNISPLIVQGVHERDIIRDIAKLKIHTVFEQEWVRQLRFYLEEKDIYTRCMQTNFPYGQEYMGNADRLVITPLTDKCYMTLMGALKLNLGGAPAGPAGTGKTETTKDLSKNLAKLCKIFNCGPEMEYKMIGTFFKGLCWSGAWVCFDEFNRISLEVLSVIAQYLQTLLNEKKKGERETTCLFLDTEIKVVNTFSVYITMNPTQAGRQQLPDNLKALFRPVAMMVPDQTLIAEIFFYSFGFKESSNLAVKMTGTFKLCSEQLSKQDHYDYGMRAVRSTINAAGLLKRDNPDQEEAQIVLKAVIDINLPKFLKNDIPLFRNILSDLFPGVELAKSNLGTLNASLQKCIHEMHLQPVEQFIVKVYQLFDTMNVRHGLMLVGPTGSGKTCCYKVLKNAINKIALDVNIASDIDLEANPQRKVVTRVLNPKSILNEQIQGQMNQMTKEYTKGLVPVLFNKSCDDFKNETKQWIMFDGPVDSLWIESMNSVLDDSKKLCLPNSEIIDMTEFMTCMFETDDLSEASPATISRCGMVQMDPKALGQSCFFDNQKNRFPKSLGETHFLSRLETLFNKSIEELLFRMRRECAQVVLTSENNYIYSLFNLINAIVAKANPDEQGEVKKDIVEYFTSSVDMIFVQACAWTIGGNTDIAGRKQFSAILKEVFQKINSDTGSNVPVPQVNSETQQDYTINVKDNKFISWADVQQKFQFKSGLSFDEINVPTLDSTKYIEITSTLMKSHYHVLKCGATGTGKSLNCDNLVTIFPATRQVTFNLTFSARTGVMTIHNTLGPKLKRRKMGVLGPDNNKKGVCLIDDLNMPKKEIYGAQPVLELLRQWYDHNGWQDMNDFEFKNIIDIFILSTMGLPGGGRSVISNRLVRHSNILTYTNMTDDSITHIQTNIVGGFYEGYKEDIKQLLDQVVPTTNYIFHEAVRFLLPIPKKPHYLFNLRDISKVFQGICNTKDQVLQDSRAFVRLWIHEMNRVFRDRLVDKKDLNEFDSLIRVSIENRVSIDINSVFDKERILFGDFMDKDADNRVQREIENLEKLQTVLQEVLEDYNNENSPMSLILFSDACEHISRTCRIIGFPKGNALLMGVGGSGRQSCCKLANFVMNQKIFQIEITKDQKIEKSWREDVKKCLLFAGNERQPITFLLVDTQIVDDKQLEDFNNILNTGDVPNLYDIPDFEDINKKAKKDCQEKGIDQTPLNLFNAYLSAVKKNIHIVLAMSPMSEKFRSNLMQFPSLVNCTTIDQYFEWPEDALLSVAKEQLSGKIDLGMYQKGVEKMFSIVHKSVEDFSIKMADELKRYNYVTPTSYLELIRMQQQVQNMKREEYNQMIQRYEQGLAIIENAQSKVTILQREIKEKEPELEKLEKELTVQNEHLSIELEKTDKKNTEVAEETRKQNIEVEKVTKMVNDINTEKEETEKDKDKALKLCDTLNNKEIGEVSQQNNPPAAISFCMKLIVMLFDKDKLVKDKNEAKEWFNVSKKELLNDVHGLKNELVARIKKEEITEKQFKKIEPFQEELCKTDLKGASTALHKMGEWVKAMRSIFLVNEKLAPIKAQLAEGQKKLNEGQKLLDELNKQKEECEAKVSELRRQADECNKKKESTQNEVETNKLKLVRAKKLLDGLADEKARWEEEVKRLRYEMGQLVGNCIVAAGMMSYGGAFDSHQRKMLSDQWVKRIQEQGVPLIDNVSLMSIAGKKVTIEGWKGIQGLPDDQLSIENGIILENTKRWPLCIDPQGQANSFIRKMGAEKKNNFKILRSNDEKTTIFLEGAIKFGQTILIEGVTEKLSPDLDPVLVPQQRTKGKNKTIKFGDKEIDYNNEFKFYMTTTIPSPHQTPETCVKICLINFSITESGLKDQMLSLVVSIEKSDLEQERNNLIETNAKNEKILKEKEDEILADLQNSDPETILNEDDLINKLYITKSEATRIKKDQEVAKIREEQIRVERNKYIELARKSSLLFFTLVDMAKIDHMYQYSLNWYKYQFEKATEKADPSEIDDIRISSIYNTFIRLLQREVCRTLLDKDKLLFSFNMTVKLMMYFDRINMDHFRQLLSGNTEDLEIPSPPDFVDSLSWSQMYKTIAGLKHLKGFEGFNKQFSNNLEKFKAIYNAEDPKRVPFPGEWQERLDPFQKLLVQKGIRPDQLTQAIREQIKTSMDPFFINPPLFAIDEGVNSSTKDTPIIFIITPGSDPLNDLREYTWNQTGRPLVQISLGQGQGPIALSYFKRCSEDGQWLFFQNTHLYLSWMNQLEKLVEDLKKPEVSPEFRLFLTTSSTPDFPVSILQDGVKMTVESTGDVKQIMLNAYQGYSDDFLSSCKQPDLFKTMLFGCTLFHALLIDRKKFGPIGWTSPTQDFADTDLSVTKDQLKMMIDEQNELQYTVIRTLASVINQGGRVTDDKDERFIRTLVNRFLSPEMITNPSQTFDDNNIYRVPKPMTQIEYIEHISEQQDKIVPELFGLHSNADITTNQAISEVMLNKILSIQNKVSTTKAGKSPEDLNEEKANWVRARVPAAFDLELIEMKYPTSQEESMNTVLTQECARQNNLLKTMVDEIKQFINANRGRVVMNSVLEDLGMRMMRNEVPSSWTEEKGCGFLSVKPLTNWLAELAARVEFLTGWEKTGTPKCFWMSGFFFPQAFLTGLKQNFARKFKHPIDIVDFEYEFINDKYEREEVQAAATEGGQVSGMYLEGCRQDNGIGQLVDSNPRELQTKVPILWLKPVVHKTQKTSNVQQCPIYKTLARQGTLSTTGHSTNFVMMIDTPTQQSGERWIKAGVAAFLSLKFD